MACYIGSNNNRVYAAIESSFGSAAAVSEANRLPVTRMQVRERRERGVRRDKTGGRTYLGVPDNLRRRADLGLSVYHSGWDPASGEPNCGALMQAALGAAGVVFPGMAVASASGSTLQTAAPHGLVPGQAVAFGGEMRFVEGVVDASAVILNAGFKSTPAPGAALRKTITYFPGDSNPSVSVYDYWDPAESVQRLLCGTGINGLKVRLNGDFHEFEFTGSARSVADSSTFQSGQAGLTQFPPEPQVAGWSPSLVPGNLGQVWLGHGPSEFFNVLDAEIRLDNALEMRVREFGEGSGGCLAGGMRDVRVDLTMFANTSAELEEMFAAGRARARVPMAFQLGNQAHHLCGIYLKSVGLEAPEFDDRETKLVWKFTGARAEGTHNDEIVVAFA
jgi:hypothetical protein